MTFDEGESLVSGKIIEREVMPYGGKGAHISLPRSYIGHKVYVLDQTLKGDLQELIETTLLYRKLDALERKDFSAKFDAFKKDIGERLVRIEKSIFQ
jgi:hypothetical protein